MRAADFREEAEKDRDFHRLLHRYTQALFTQVIQSASCNRLHRVENRCSRWLLLVHTQAGRDNFMLTQEFLSQMLAVRRASVQSAASALQKAGLIEYRRGKLTIRDRAGLEKASCECYRIIQQEIENIFA